MQGLQPCKHALLAVVGLLCAPGLGGGFASEQAWGRKGMACPAISPSAHCALPTVWTGRPEQWPDKKGAFGTVVCPLSGLRSVPTLWTADTVLCM